MEKNNKILIATGIYPPDVGGPATLLLILPQALRERGYDIKVITYSDIESTVEEKKDGIFRVSRRGTPLISRLKYFWLMLRLSFWADIIYTTDLYSAGRFSYLIKKLTGKKYILRFAGDSAWEKAAVSGWTKDGVVDFEEKKQDSRSEVYKKRRRRILKNADRIIAVSDFMAGLAEKIGAAPANIAMVYNAVDFFQNLPRRQESQTPLLVFAGRLVPWKNQMVILRVLAKLKIKYPEIIFEILGDGPEEKNLKIEVEKLGLGKNVIFRGRVSEEESHEIFSRATIFILNTNYEGLSHAVLNAMQIGAPIITTPVGGNPETIKDGENGLLVPYNNEAAWLAAIEKLLADEPLRKRMAANAKESLKKFKFEEMAAGTLKVLKSL